MEINITEAKDLFIVVCLFFILVCYSVIVNAIYFQIRYQKKTDQLLYGDSYIDGGWLFNAQRMMMYAHYCLFDKRAKRAGVFDQVQKMPSVIRFHLLVHWVLVIIGGLSLVVLWVLDHVYLD